MKQNSTELRMGRDRQCQFLRGYGVEDAVSRIAREAFRCHLETYNI
jgi:hypothetical protein